ncbi:hypothetical protein [Okeania sp.]|uniref:hypothetical protein n=1 Tax=Okeania sp. TaxID=3100323 RepID=UPI002B4AB8A7|nr:hypothetical protein [Okeania sp.]MEB3342698.1 hypothetical protein [Okeania sp.]
MGLWKNQFLTSGCLSALITFGAIYPAVAAPENEKIAQGSRSLGASQMEVIGYVKGIIGNVVTLLVEDEEELGIAGIAGNSGEPTYVKIPASERGQLRTLYFSPKHNIEIAGLVPGSRVYAVVGKATEDKTEDPYGCIDFFKVIPDYNYERVEVKLPEYNFQGPGSIEFPRIEAPPVSPIRQPAPVPIIEPNTSPIRGLW